MNIIGVHKVHPRRKKAKFTAVDIADRREQESAAFMRRAVNTVHRRLERGRMRSMVIPTSTSVSHQLIASAVSNEVLSQDQVQAHIDGKKIYRGVHKWSPYERSLLRPPAPPSVEQPGAELDLLPPIEAAQEISMAAGGHNGVSSAATMKRMYERYRKEGDALRQLTEHLPAIDIEASASSYGSGGVAAMYSSAGGKNRTMHDLKRARKIARNSERLHRLGMHNLKLSSVGDSVTSRRMSAKYPSPMPPPPLPNGWTAYTSGVIDAGVPYYHCFLTGATTWVCPLGITDAVTVNGWKKLGESEFYLFYFVIMYD